MSSEVITDRKSDNQLCDDTKHSISNTSSHAYDKISKYNVCRTILDTIGIDLLSEIVEGYLSILGTSAVVFERTGEYAFGMFSSGWCKYMGSSSRKLCNTPSDSDAFASGKWVCLESCQKISMLAMEKGEAVDMPCSGGINIYAVPIMSGSDIVGSISFGHGRPPQTSQDINTIAEKYSIDVESMQLQVDNYCVQATYIVDIARKQINTAATLIGEIVRRKQAEVALQKNTDILQTVLNQIPIGICLVDSKGSIIQKNPAARQIWSNSSSINTDKGKFPVIQRLSTGEEYGCGDVDPCLALSQGDIDYDELLVIKNDSNNKIIKNEVATIFNSLGYLDTMIVISQDVTKDYNNKLEITKSEQRYHLLSDITKEGLLIHDNGIIIDANRAAIKLIGLKEECIIGTNILDYILDEDKHFALEKMNTNNASPFTIRVLRADGSTFYAEIESQYIQVDNIKYRAVSVRDITERMWAMKSLTESEDRFSKAFKLNPTPLVIVDIKSARIIDINDECINHLGYSKEDFLGRTAPELNLLVNPDDNQKMFHLVELYGSAKNIPMKVRTATGAILDLIISAESIVIFEQKAILLSFWDETDRIKAREAILREKLILQNILEDTLSGYWDWDIVNNIEYLSPTFKRMFGYEDDEIPNAPEAWQKLMVPEDLVAILKNLNLHISSNGKVPFYSESRFIHKAGHIVWVICAGRVIDWDENGKPLRMVGCHIDITRQKEFEAELIDAKEEAIKAKEEALLANNAKSIFMANMSHELKTPLNGVIGMMNLLRLTQLTEEQLRYISIAVGASTSLLGLLSDILDISQTEKSKIELMEEPFDLTTLCESVSDLFAATVKEKGIELRYSIESPVPVKLVGDASRLRQILLNIVGNAIKFSENNIVEYNVTPLPVVKNGELRVLFSVIDNGVGIPETMLDDIFKPFVQVDTSYTKKYHGAGLGLPIVRRLVEAMGGSLQIDSRVGIGTCVFFVLTFKTVTNVNEFNPHKNMVTNENSFIYRKLNILVVEDDSSNQFFIQQLMGRLGHVTTIVGNGKLAIENLENNSYDCILMDINMPVMSGLDAIHYIKNTESMGSKSNTPIIVLTAYVSGSMRKTLSDAGISSIMEKPIDVADLETAINKAVFNND